MDNRKQGQALQKLRGERTQKEIAVQIEISQNTLSAYESGRIVPSPKVREKLAKVLGQAVLEIDWPPSHKAVSYNHRQPKNNPVGAPGDLLKALRLRKELTQAEVARRVAVDEQHYARIERGYSKKPEPDLLTKMAQVLGPEVLEIFAIV